MFPTNTHPGKVPEGPALLRQVADALGDGGAGGAGGGEAGSESMGPEGPTGPKAGVEGAEVEARMPVLIGVGGVDESNCAEVLRAGGDGVAVISAVCRADDPAAAAVGLARRLQAEGAAS
jgi:thiamine-phosphate pyrophosphorylase